MFNKTVSFEYVYEEIVGQERSVFPEGVWW